MDHALWTGLTGSLGVLLLGVALHDFRLGQEYGFLRVDCLVGEIAAGLGMAFCFGGAMHFADMLRADGAAWHWRVALLVLKRMLMVLQLGAMAIVLVAVGTLLFGKDIPGPDQTVLERGWTPATTQSRDE